MKYIALLFIPVFLLALLTTSCQKDESTDVKVGDPKVLYIRSTDPAKADSLLVGAFMGSLIAIVGEDLGATREIWFNDQQATLNPAYITDRTILVNVPSAVPSEVNDKIRFVFADDSELLYDFKVNVPGPTISAIKSEFVPDGGVAVLTGDFFFEPRVFFPGGLEGEVVSLEKTRLEVIVPDGAGAGSIEVRTNFGNAKSGFLFRDDRNILLDFDAWLHETWTAPIAYAGENPTPAPCSGNYAYFQHDNNGAWNWTNELTMQYWAPRGRGNEPLANGSIHDLVFRFEANSTEWTAVRMEIFLGPFAEDHGRDRPNVAIARWAPWEDGPYLTDGWETVSIPLTEFKYNTGNDDADRSIQNLSSLTNITMMIFGPADGTAPVHVAIDNIRIVPKSGN